MALRVTSFDAIWKHYCASKCVGAAQTHTITREERGRGVKTFVIGESVGVARKHHILVKSEDAARRYQYLSKA